LLVLEITVSFLWYTFFRHNDGSSKWYKFDDGEVSECKMDDEEEMKTQCFGGDYMGEVS
jgi:ubiquitin carboxyl-terminal hydrolase 9/24